jgi:general secretion pathway protein M
MTPGLPADAPTGAAAAGALRLRRALEPVAQRWQALPGRERRLLLLAAAVLSAYALWALAVQPAWRVLEKAPAERDALETQWQTMQRLAAEVRELRSAPPVGAEQAAAALKAATDRLGEAGRLSLQGERAVLTLNGVGTQALQDWLSEVRSGARARPVEASLSRGARGYSGTLVLALGGGT